MKKTIFLFLIMISVFSCSREWRNPLGPDEDNDSISLPTDGLVAWYPFNGNANAESWNGNDGVINGPVLTSDRFNNATNAYSFDGLDDYIDIGNKVKPNFPIR